IYIQLPFFEKGKNECDSLIDQWIYNLKNMGPMQEVAFKSRNEIFRRLEKISNVASLTPEERYSYDADVKNARDTLNQMRYAYNEGEAKGRAEGRAEVIAEKIMEARRMGLSEDLIASLFGPQSNN
ncbi:MAG: Rpn family recombination-promoting nuclease/putative transposase, partial [Muribaculaceae bacterium]|nr:Rpn family recombination-promoting nuclease/putative transposase [Muribaculaceae bacterium]